MIEKMLYYTDLIYNSNAKVKIPVKKLNVKNKFKGNGDNLCLNFFSGTYIPFFFLFLSSFFFKPLSQLVNGILCLMFH